MFPPMPLLSITSSTTITKCKDLPLRASDVFICSYPKSGTTWTQQIVLSLILADKRYAPSTTAAAKSGEAGDINTGEADGTEQEYNHVSGKSALVQNYAPFYEIDAHWETTSKQLTEKVRSNHDKLGRRVFNTHLRWDMSPKFAETDSSQEHCNTAEQHPLRPTTGKFIYITRSQSDVVTSFYYHLSNQKEGTYTHGYTSFVLDWMAGNVAFGSSLHHLLSFVNGLVDNEYARTLSSSLGDIEEEDTATSSTQTQGQPLLLLSYEALKHNLRSEVQRIISFLNLKHIPSHILDNELLPSFTFASMKSNSSKFQPKSVTWLNNYQFLRKGIVGDGRELMMTTKVYDEKKGRDISLLELFHDWVKDEGYREHIEKLIECDRLEKDVGDQFLALVD